MRALTRSLPTCNPTADRQRSTAMTASMVSQQQIGTVHGGGGEVHLCIHSSGCPTELHDLLHLLSEVVNDVPEICLTRVFEESEAECATARDNLQQQHAEKMEALVKEHVRVTLKRAMLLVVQLASSTQSSLHCSGFSYVPAEACPGAPQQGERVGCTGPPREGETQAGLAAPLSACSSREGGPHPPQPTHCAWPLQHPLCMLHTRHCVLRLWVGEGWGRSFFLPTPPTGPSSLLNYTAGSGGVAC